MCTGAEAAAVFAAMASVGNAANQPKPPKPQEPKAPPQASTTADRGSALRNNTGASMPGGPMSGNSGTFLTGPGGVDPTTLNLGKSTLLGQ